MSQIHTDFFQCLPPGSSLCRGIPRVDASTGECDVPAPRVTVMLRSSYEQYTPVRADDDRHRSLARARKAWILTPWPGCE